METEGASTVRAEPLALGPTLAPAIGVASGKSPNTSEPSFLCCKIKKIESTRMNYFLGFKKIIYVRYVYVCP